MRCTSVLEPSSSRHRARAISSSYNVTNTLITQCAYYCKKSEKSRHLASTGKIFKSIWLRKFVMIAVQITSAPKDGLWVKMALWLSRSTTFAWSTVDRNSSHGRKFLGPLNFQRNSEVDALIYPIGGGDDAPNFMRISPS